MRADTIRHHEFDLNCEGIILKLNLPNPFTRADYLEAKLAPIIQETIKALIKDQIDTLHANNTQISRLPKELCNIVANMLFFQPSKRDTVQSEPTLKIPTIIKK